MGKYSKKSDNFVEDKYTRGLNSERYEAEKELIRRGFNRDDNGSYKFEKDYEGHSEKYEPTNLGPLFLIIVGTLLLITALFCTHFILGYSINFTLHIWIGFGVSLVLAILSKGRSKFFNFIFFLGCFSILTRFFVTIIEYTEGTTYIEFLSSNTTDLIDLIKYGFFYAIYIFFAPYFLMKYGTFYIRTLTKSKHKRIHQ